VNDLVTWLNDPQNWRGTRFAPGIPGQIGAHLEYTAIALAIAAVIGIPLGLVLGHTGRGGWLVTVANGLRSLPTIGLLILLYVIVSPLIHGRGDAVYLVPTEIVLVLLALPAVLANTYAGVRNVPPEVRDAARGMGMTGRQVLFGVELPNALPLMYSGVRSATLQVIATATIAAYVGLGGLGRYLYDGLASHDFGQMYGGAVLVAVLALLVDLVLALLQRLTVSRGVSGRFSRRVARADGRSAAVTELAGPGQASPATPADTDPSPERQPSSGHPVPARAAPRPTSGENQ
jgi:osmoprotectant transport system permease protein